MLALSPAPVDGDLMALANQFLDGFRGRSDPCLTGLRLERNTNVHDYFSCGDLLSFKSQRTSDGALGRLWSADPPNSGRAKHFADEARGLQPVLERNEVKTTSHPVTVCRNGQAAACQT